MPKEWILFGFEKINKIDNRSIQKRMVGKQQKKDKISWQRKVHMRHRYFEKSLTQVKKRQGHKMMIRLDVIDLQISASGNYALFRRKYKHHAPIPFGLGYVNKIYI